MTELIKENALFLPVNLAVVPVLLSIPALNVPGSIFCIEKFIDDACATTRLQAWQKMYHIHLMQSTG